MRSLPLILLGAAASAFASVVPDQLPMDNGLASDKWHWADCGQSTDAIQVREIIVTPDPPVPGEDMTVTAIGTAQEEIEDGAYADVTVKLGLVKILTKTFDVCEEARNANATIQCPVKPGEHKVTQTVALPKEIPKAIFKVHIEGYTVEDEPMLCLDLYVDFMKKRWPGLW